MLTLDDALVFEIYFSEIGLNWRATLFLREGVKWSSSA